MKTIRFPRSGSFITTKDFERDLLEDWLSMSREGREQKFASTARAAEIAGVSQRTVQFWIESGHLISIRIGKKHKIYLPSLINHISPQASPMRDGIP